jgi:hypothetical protein
MDYPYVIVRTTNAGAFAGYLTTPIDRKVALTEARRLWFWSGAASLSELAKKGPANPELCKFPVAVDVTLLEVIEVIDASEGGEAIRAVPVWTAHE